MSFLRSRAEQLADHLRGAIARGEVIEPLPNIRDWSSRLGVGRGTLELALKILHEENVVRIRPRKGVEIGAGTEMLQKPSPSPIVRWIFHGRDFPDLSGLREMFETTSVRLAAHKIGLRVEKCDSARLRAIHQKGESPHEMLMLCSMPRKFQKLFSDFRHNAILNGMPLDGITLPFASVDVVSALRHAIHRLARRGFGRVHVVIKEGSRQPLHEAVAQFCAEAPRLIKGEIIKMPMELHPQSAAAYRWSRRLNSGLGVVAIYPIPASVLMTALMKRGFDVPRDAEVVAINTTLQAVRCVPMPTYYPYPVEAFAKIICRAAVHYFGHGAVPLIHKQVPLEMVAAHGE